MAMPLVERMLAGVADTLTQAPAGELDELLEHLVWLIAQLRSTGSRALALEGGQLWAASTDDGGAVPIEPAAWARELVATAGLS
jgi:hypothetical protein